MRHNVTFRYVIAFIVIGSVLILTVPSLQRVLKFAPLGLAELLLVGLTGVILLMLFEFAKGRAGRRSHAP
jgi:Ca2+-transporting ATPase